MDESEITMYQRQEIIDTRNREDNDKFKIKPKEGGKQIPLIQIEH